MSKFLEESILAVNLTHSQLFLIILLNLTGTIDAIVAIRVLNKTSDEYWFAVKVNFSYVPGNVDLREEKTMMTDYFVVRLETSRRYSTKSVLSFNSYVKLYIKRINFRRSRPIYKLSVISSSLQKIQIYNCVIIA